ncbi:unnamed protein product, partial [Phaeothamnion confervicola]
PTSRSGYFDFRAFRALFKKGSGKSWKGVACPSTTPLPTFSPAPSVRAASLQNSVLLCGVRSSTAMGISGLLPVLRPVTRDIHVRDLHGLTVAVDTYCWLHKAIHCCATELCMDQPTDKYIAYCRRKLDMLLQHGVKPYLVFDGAALPAKAGKEQERAQRREDNRRRGFQLRREGQHGPAHQHFAKAVDVTPYMAWKLIQACRPIPGVRCLVAPYEADAQLGFLSRGGYVDAVITEDSDVLLFGCQRVIFKLDGTGAGEEVRLADVFARRNDDLDMRGRSHDELVLLCALSGCDYTPSLPGMGLKKAHRIVTQHGGCLAKVLRALRLEWGAAATAKYCCNLLQALLTFRHQRVFDPEARRIIHMTPAPTAPPLRGRPRHEPGMGGGSVSTESNGSDGSSCSGGGNGSGGSGRSDGNLGSSVGASSVGGSSSGGRSGGGSIGSGGRDASGHVHDTGRSGGDGPLEEYFRQLGGELDFLGAAIDDDVAAAIADARVDPATLRLFAETESDDANGSGNGDAQELPSVAAAAAVAGAAASWLPGVSVTAAAAAAGIGGFGGGGAGGSSSSSGRG